MSIKMHKLELSFLPDQRLACDCFTSRNFVARPSIVLESSLKRGLSMLVRITDEEAAVMVEQRGELHSPWPRQMPSGKWFAHERDVKDWRAARFVSLPPASQNTSGATNGNR
jgi:hypothetical protein